MIRLRHPRMTTEDSRVKRSDTIRSRDTMYGPIPDDGRADKTISVEAAMLLRFETGDSKLGRRWTRETRNWAELPGGHETYPCGFVCQEASLPVDLMKPFSFGPSSSITFLYSATRSSDAMTLRRIALRSHALVSSNEPRA